MSLQLTSPLSGVAQTGQTSPTFTLTADTAPDTNGKQWVVSALGGTQGNASANTVGFPFVITLWRPKVWKAFTGAIASLVGFNRSVPRNEWTYKTIKGVAVNSVGGISIAEIETRVRIPVGAFTSSNGPDDLKSLHACHLGMLTQTGSQFYDNEAAGTL